MLANALDSDALYSRSDSSYLDMVKIEAKPPVYDHNSCSNSSCSEDDLEAPVSYSDTRDIEVNKRNLQAKKECTHRNTLTTWDVVPDVRISP